ncbi:type II toxin-antitoxin system RelE/ParE family toxin [Niveispirillum sp. BGYR6]|uniref:type II toxin-antitoxin system RelE/ParE family toxin n=1 Tax=Niveispirillum sp. BGYR6 TaxID=2971249 RepID=UPI0022B99082|nr:type II toxin-antitoxin system RelE/ParE family toxin [Niveispirillum sp. BGYR6]MDG5495352.1 type II toxin-antitoxin system RelE/ParE family toxin [Niveispirillum sp. BGYR6]
MPLVEFSQQADRDLIIIWRFIADNNKAAADALVRKLGKSARLYAQNPAMGRLSPQLGADIRCFPLGRYLIFYRPQPDGILVIRILHAARDIDAEFPHD